MVFLLQWTRERKDTTFFVSYVFSRGKNVNEIEFDGVTLKELPSLKNGKKELCLCTYSVYSYRINKS